MKEPVNVIPPRFMKTLSAKEFEELCRRDGFFTPEQIERLWRMTDRQGPRPERLQMMVSKKDLERWLKTVKPVKKR